MESKEFLEWKDKIESGEVGILFIGSTEEYVGRMQMTLIEEFGVRCSEEFRWDDEEAHEPLSEYTIELVKIEEKSGMLITMGVDKDLAKEFQDYQSEIRKVRFAKKGRSEQ